MNEDKAREIATALIIEASNVEFQTIVDRLWDEVDGLTEDEEDKWARRIDNLIIGADITVNLRPHKGA